jgi:DNA-binding winged helix-turn-helix (wHTH) protein/predicted ATPase
LLYLFDNYTLDSDRRELRRGSELVPVQPQVFDVLYHLTRNRDRVVSKDALLADIWQGRIVSEATLSSRINAARSAVGDTGERQRLIRTVLRKGFLFVGAVREQQRSAESIEIPQPEASGSSADQTVPMVIAPEQPPGTHSDVERRQLTILSTELIGSSGRMDPEDLRDLTEAYHDCVTQTVARFGGFVDRHVRSTITVYFGYPAADEHDAEQAVRAGLEICSAVGAFKADTGRLWQCRVGIATGLVVIGKSAGEPTRGDPVGDALNIAARLNVLAQPNTLLIDTTTKRLLGNLFQCRDLGVIDMAETNTPGMRAWQVLAPTVSESRFEALHSGSLTPLVGREEELEILLRRWTQAKGGEGRVVLISGEPGIGKSRLALTLRQALQVEPHICLRYFCSPHHSDSALYPVIAQLKHAARMAHDDSPQARLNKLDTLLAQAATSKQDAALIADMLSLPNDGRYPALELTPQQRRQRTLEAFVAQVRALAHHNPVVMIFEDAHWSDPTTLEMLDRVAERIRTLRILLIVTFRPEFEPPWIGQPHVTALTINRLGQREVRAMIEQVAGSRLIPADIREDIIDRTDGIPLFVEEMTKAVLEAEVERADEHAAAPPEVIAVPTSLHASLIARLDRLGVAKEVAQVGAVIGREFSHRMLAAVMGKPEPELGEALGRLITTGLLFRQGVPPDATYLFKHALVRDTAYGTLLRETRRALHAKIADTLSSQFAEIAENQPELLAHHYTESELIEKAATLWGKAGERSLERSALVEAAEQLSRALDQIATLTTTPALRREGIKLQVALANALMHIKGYAAPESKAAEERARLLIEQAEALGEPAEDPLLIYSVLYGIWAANYVAFNGAAMRELAAQFLSLAEKKGAPIPRMVGHRIMGYTTTLTGDPAEARAHFNHAITIYDSAKHRPLATRFGVDVGVSILTYRSIALWLLGYPEAALADTERALKDSSQIEHAATLMYALAHASLTHLQCGNYAAASAEADEGIALAEEKGAVFWTAMTRLVQGCLLALTGRPSDAVEVINSGITSLRSTGATCWLPMHLSYLAKAYTNLGQFEDAWRCVDKSIMTVRGSNENWWEAEVHRTAGEIALKSPDPDHAKPEAYFKSAMAVARTQQAMSLELRSATSMARLWRDQGKRHEARDLLASVYARFTEGFDTRDLKKAKALLDMLAV